MKLLILALLFTVSSFAQEVSPYYPAKQIVNDPFDFTSQLTYFDLNYISSNISEFLTYRMNMTVEKTDDAKLLYEGGEVTTTYTDRISSSGNHKLIINYSVGKVNDVFVIKSVKFSGNKDRIYSFFVEFWQTTMNFEAPAKNADVSLRTGQDIVKLAFNKGKPTITVTNTTYKNIQEFQTHFNKLVADKNSLTER